MVDSDGGTTLAVSVDRDGLGALVTVTLPSILVDDQTRDAIDNEDHVDHDTAAINLERALADAAREECHRVVDADTGFPAITSDSCDSTITEFTVNYGRDSQPLTGDLLDVPTDPICEAECLVGDNCDGNATGGPPDPDARSVQCQCLVQTVNLCAAGGYAPTQRELVEDFCLPADETLPADFCRNEVQTYLEASVRMFNDVSGIQPTPCGGFGPGATPPFEVVVECSALEYDDHDLHEEAAFAYSGRNDTCAVGCGGVSCIEDSTCTPGGSISSACGTPGEPDCNFDCDCDFLPDDCLDEFCTVFGADGGADGGPGPGGGPEFIEEPCADRVVCIPDPAPGGGGRLKSATTVLDRSTWVQTQHGDCTPLDPLPPSGDPPQTVLSSTVTGFATNNGTGTAPAALLQTCPAPSTDGVDLTTFDFTLEELCDAIPLCGAAADLSLDLTVSENTTTLASGTLVKTAGVTTTTSGTATLAVGSHTLDICVEDDDSGIEGCMTQEVEATAPLGSGIDGYGYFAGEMAGDFIPLAGKAEATSLSLSDDQTLRTAMPSGFSFPFYGPKFSDWIWVGSNGGVRFSAGSISATNTAIPGSSSSSDPDIAVFWDDLDPGSGGGVYTWFDGTRFIVSWEDVPHGRGSGGATSGGASVQIHLYETGRIELHYADVDFGDSSHDFGLTATLGVNHHPSSGGSYGVEVSHDSRTLLDSGVVAVGLQEDDDGCLADHLRVPPEVGCAAYDHFATVCTATDDTVFLPLPDVAGCADGSSAVEGEVIESGSKEAALVALSTPIPITSIGKVDLDEGVHRVRWWPVDSSGDHIGPAFSQLVFVETWVHTGCGSSQSRSSLIMTEDPDTMQDPPPGPAVAVLGLSGFDVLQGAAGSDFLGDGAGAGVCEAAHGDDFLVGEGGDDTLDGGPGQDKAWGGAGDDLLIGANGADALHGGIGDDVVQGDNGDDVLWGGPGDDILEGGDDDDVIYPGAGVDSVFGGQGDDTIVVLSTCEVTSGALLSGGSGSDVLALPVGLSESDLASAGVVVHADIETVINDPDLPVHKAACRPE